MNIPEGIKKVAVLSVLKSGDQFLLLHRHRQPNKDMFTPVGGKIDPFETPLQAAIRETREETGIEVANMRYCGVLVETSPTPYNWISFVFIADIPYQEAPYCKEGTLQWIPQSQLKEIPTPVTDWHIYDYLRQGNKFHFDAHYDANLNLLHMKDEWNDIIVFSK